MIFYDVPTTGSFTINGLTVGADYQYYMIIEKNGWERMSQIIRFTETGSPAIMTILDPATKIATANNTGAIIPPIIGLTTTSVSGWNAFTPDSWITITGGSSGVSGPGSFGVSAFANTGYNVRTGSISIASDAPTEIINVTQARRSSINHNVYMSTYVSTNLDAKGRVNISPALDLGQSITLNVYLKVQARADGNVSHNNVNTYSAIDLFKNGIKVVDCSVFSHSAGGNNKPMNDATVAIPNVVNGDIIEIRQQKMDCAHLTSGINAYAESAGYMELVSADDGWDSFDVTSMGQQFWNVSKLWGSGCIFQSNVSNVGTLLP